MPALSHLHRALLAAVALRAGIALAVPPPAPLPLATTTVISQASAAPSPTPMRRAPDPDPAPWPIGIPVLTGVSFKLPIPKVGLTRYQTTYTKDTITATGRPFGMRPGHGLGGLRGHDRHGGHGGHGGHAAYGGWDGLGGIGGGFGGFDGGLGGDGGLDIWPLHGMPEHGMQEPPPHRRPEDVSHDPAGDLGVPPLPVAPGRIPGSQYSFTSHGRHGHDRQHHLRGLRRWHLPAAGDERLWYERPHWRPATDAYDDFDDDDNLDMGPPPPWMDPTPVVQETENTTRTDATRTTFTQSAKVTGTGTKTLKKIWDTVKTGKAIGIWGRPGGSSKEKRADEVDTGMKRKPNRACR